MGSLGCAGIVKLTPLDQGGKQVILGLRYSGSQLGLRLQSWRSIFRHRDVRHNVSDHQFQASLVRQCLRRIHAWHGMRTDAGAE